MKDTQTWHGLLRHATLMYTRRTQVFGFQGSCNDVEGQAEMCRCSPTAASISNAAIRVKVRTVEAENLCAAGIGAFSHADHVAVAYQILRSHDFLDAVVKYARCIVMIATNAGAAQKFNTTITLAFLSLIAERMEATEHLSYDEFISKNSDLLADGILDKWYSPDRLKSELARRVFLMPDALVIEVQT